MRTASPLSLPVIHLAPEKRCPLRPSAAATLRPLQANTVAVVSVPRGMSHAEGGWAKDDVEGLLRFRRKVEKDEDYIRTVVRLGGVVEELVKQNNAIDIYEQYFAGGCWWSGWLGVVAAGQLDRRGPERYQ